MDFLAPGPRHVGMPAQIFEKRCGAAFGRADDHEVGQASLFSKKPAQHDTMFLSKAVFAQRPAPNRENLKNCHG
jgi:hypothetical protein